MTSFGAASNKNSPRIRWQSWWSVTRLQRHTLRPDPNGIRLFPPHRSSGVCFGLVWFWFCCCFFFFLPPNITLDCFLFTSAITTTKADSKQSTIPQLMFWSSSWGLDDWEGFTSQTGLWSARSPGSPTTCWPLEWECCIFLHIFPDKTEDWIFLFKMHFAFFVCFVMLRCF